MQNGNELARFYGLSITAGIVEEVLWRGFLIWYLSQFMPVWGAALISTIGFGLAHAYQGLRQVPQITIVGADDLTRLPLRSQLRHLCDDALTSIAPSPDAPPPMLLRCITS